MSETVAHDFEVYADQSVALVTPHNDRARKWLIEWTDGELVEFSGGLAVELRFVQELCDGILDAGFTIQKDGMSMVRSSEGELVLEETP